MNDFRLALILNPRAGLSRRHFGFRPAGEIVDYFSSIDVPASLFTTSSGLEAGEIALRLVDLGYTHVLACGGDGTINSVVNGLVGSEVTLGAIPLGTENVFCKAMKVPLDVTEACRHFMNATERRIDVAVANGRHFIIMSGIGLDAKVVAEMEPELKDALGSIGFLIKGALTLLFGDDDLQSKVLVKFYDRDEEIESDAWLILVSNIPNYSGTVKVARKAMPDDGLLDILIFSTRNENDITNQIFEVMTDESPENVGISYVTSSDFEIFTNPPVYCQIDGEPLGKTPVHYRVKHNSLKIRI